MSKAILLLRLSYWVAAIADFGIAVVAWMPKRMGVIDTVYPMGLAAVMAFSWGVLLLLADRKPFERRWILIPTILVVTLIISVRVKFSLDGAVAFSTPLLVFAIAVIILLTYSYYYSSRYATNH